MKIIIRRVIIIIIVRTFGHFSENADEFLKFFHSATKWTSFSPCLVAS
jgi:hypothetical protein